MTTKTELSHTIELPQPGQPLEIGPDVAEKAKQSIFDQGVFYIVPVHKLEYHQNRATRSISITPDLEPVFGSFKNPETGVVTLDAEDLAPQVLSGSDVGINASSLADVRHGISEYFHLTSGLVSRPEIIAWMKQNISSADQRRLEIDHLVTPGLPTPSVITAGTLVRVDILTRQDGRIVSCDPNLIPLGMAYNHGFASSVERETGHRILQSQPYITELAGLAAKSDGISGFLTGLNYSNWSSHMYIAETVSQQTGQPFFIIPDQCLTPDGQVDVAALKHFYGIMGLPTQERLPDVSRAIPANLIRYSREVTAFHPETNVINPPGSRAAESQIWGALASIPGFDSSLASLGLTADLNAISDITTPSLLARLNGSGLEIAVSARPDIRTGFDLEWVPANEHLDYFEAAAGHIGSKEKLNERSWFLKTPATSGKKGVRFTNDGIPAKAPVLVEKIAAKGGFDGIFIIQPKIRSTLVLPDGERRLKSDIFLTGQDLDFSGADSMITPVNQRSAHGGSDTQTCLLKVNGV